MSSRAERDRAYRERNKVAVYARQAQWRAANAEHLKTREAKRRLEKRAMCLVATCRTRAQRRGIEFDLDTHVGALQARIDAGRCEVTGWPFSLSPGRNYDSPSLDRIDAKRGYVYDNTRVVLNLVNVAMGDWGENVLANVMRSWLSR